MEVENMKHQKTHEIAKHVLCLASNILSPHLMGQRSSQTCR